MLSLSESELAFGVMVFIGFIVIGFATCAGKLIIQIFGTEYQVVKFDHDPAMVKSDIHEAA